MVVLSVTWCQEWDFKGLKMEKYLVPEPVGEGDLTDQWTRFKKEFGLFLTAIGKGDSASAV